MLYKLINCYLQWDSHHSLSAKYSVIGTPTHRGKTVCTNPHLLDKEVEHLREVMGKCEYPNWAINKVQSKVLNNNWGKMTQTTTTRFNKPTVKGKIQLTQQKQQQEANKIT